MEAPALFLDLIHQTAWNTNSAKLVVDISGVSLPKKVEMVPRLPDNLRQPRHVVTNGARKRSKRLRLATVLLRENSSASPGRIVWTVPYGAGPGLLLLGCRYAPVGESVQAMRSKRRAGVGFNVSSPQQLL